MVQIKRRKERDLATIAAIVKYILIVAVTVALVYGGLRAFLFLMPIFIGLVLARTAITGSELVLQGVGWLKRKTVAEATPMSGGKAKKRVAVFLYVLLFLIVMFLLYLLVSTFVVFLSRIADELPDIVGDANLIETITSWVKGIASRSGGLISETSVVSLSRTLNRLQSQAMEQLPDLLGKVLGFITGVFGRLPLTLLVILVTIMSGFYFIKRSGNLYGFFLRIVPDRKIVRTSFKTASNVTQSVFRLFGGYIVLMIAEFIQAVIGFMLIGVPNAAAWALVVAIVDLMPVLGSAAVILPMSAYYFLSGSTLQGVSLIILFVVMTVVRNLIEPPIIGNAMRLHPIVTILAMIVGIAVMGIAGLLIAPVVLVIVREIYIQFDLESTLRRGLGELLKTNEPPEDDTPEDVVVDIAIPPTVR